MSEKVFCWYPSLAEAGFGSEKRVRKMPDEETGPAIKFANSNESIFLSDFSGDGLTDIVRIRNGEISFWPNLGYGRFGVKVTMDNSPWFESSGLFNGQRIRLADIDGSGLTDIISLGSDGVQLYYNQSGNSWSTKQTLKQFPPVDDLSSVLTLDLLGNGTACLVWSSPLPGNASRAMRYIALMGGQKPHLMVKTTNNLGTATTLKYLPATEFCLRYKLAGKPWVTRVPFPVHCVEQVSVYDKWRNTRFNTTYSYHHGYYDGIERGFGRVEQIDVETFGKFSAANASSPYATDNMTLYQPPIKIVICSHTGAFLDRERILTRFEKEYYPRWFENLRSDQINLIGDLTENALPEPDLNAHDLTEKESPEALRACKGMPLRQEVYEHDVDALEEGEQVPVKLFSTNYLDCHIKRLQPKSDRYAVFLVVESQAISYHYELALAADGNVSPDPRVAHSINLRFDQYGRVVQSVAVGYARRGQHSDSFLSADEIELIRAVQREQEVVYTETHFTDELRKIPTHTGCPPLAKRLPSKSPSFKPRMIAGAIPATRATTCISQSMSCAILDSMTIGTRKQAEQSLRSSITNSHLVKTPHKRLVQRAVTLYFKDDLTGPLGFGVPSRLGLTCEISSGPPGQDPDLGPEIRNSPPRRAERAVIRRKIGATRNRVLRQRFTAAVSARRGQLAAHERASLELKGL